MNNNPLVTYCLIAYNAEAYIDEAVNSAFAQTYVPLEIIISDDCSTDETFARIEALAVAYKGPARVIINRNTTNLGIGAHVNLTFKKSSGDYFIMAAGDDISTPDRVEIIIKEFLSDPLQIKAVFSDCIVIDSLGTEQGISSATPPRQFTEPKSMCRNSFRGVTGATAAWHRDVYSIFGPMNADVTFEDRVLAFRSALLGEIRYLALPLVYYRRHETNTVGMFHVCSSEAFRKRTRCFAAVYRNAIDDLKLFSTGANISASLKIACLAIMQRELNKLQGYLRILDGGVLNALKGSAQVILNGGSPLRLLAQIHIHQKVD